MQPGRRCNDFAVVVFLWVLPKVPDVAVIVLCEEDNFGFLQFTVGVVSIPANDRADAVDLLGQVGDREDHRMRFLDPFIIDGRSLPCVLCSRLQREPFIVDYKRTLEFSGVEILVRLFLFRGANGRRRHQQRSNDREKCIPTFQSESSYHDSFLKRMWDRQT